MCLYISIIVVKFMVFVKNFPVQDEVYRIVREKT